MSDDAKPAPDLTIGELYPEGDLLGEWVFSLSVVADDLREIQRRMQTLQLERNEDLRTALMFQRLLAIRLYEARRLVYIVDEQQDIQEFLGEKPPVWFNTLREMYLPRDESRVEELYAVTRHQGVHYMWPGSKELHEALRSARHLPARVKIITRQDVATDWTRIIAGLAVFGEIDEEGWKVRMNERRHLAATLVGAWMMLNGLVIVLYAKLRGIPLERFIEQVDADEQ